MSKRFIDTELFERNWFLKLSPEERQAFIFIFCKCDCIGMYRHNIMHMYVLGSVEIEDLMTKVNGHLEKVSEDKYWLPEFCDFQYGKLSEDCRPHKKYIDELKKHGFYERVCLRVSDTLSDTLQRRVQEEDKEKDKEMEEDLEKEKGQSAKSSKYTSDFEDFWIAYERKGSKKNAFKRWQSLSLEDRHDALAAIDPYFIENPDPQYRKDAEGYLNGKLFESVLERQRNNQLNVPSSSSHQKSNADDQQLPHMPPPPQAAKPSFEELKKVREGLL